MSGQKPREIAAQVLNRARVKGDGNDRATQPDRRASGEVAPAKLDIVFDEALQKAGLTPADRRLCQELVYGVVRSETALDWLIARKTDQRLLKPRLRTILRLGLYQIFWLDRIPAHAAVHETVELARHSGYKSQTGMVNAILRAYLRESEATRQLLVELKNSQPHLGYSHPEWLVTRWQERWGKTAAAELLDWNNTPPKTFARVNLLKADPGKLLAQWRDEEVEYDFVRRDWFEENLVFELKSHPPLAGLPSFEQGLFYIQDPSTLLAVHLLDPKPGEAVLDVCAAPGGKLTYIAQRMNNSGCLVGQDLAPERLKLMQENCRRLGVTCAQFVPAAAPQPDASKVKCPGEGQIPLRFDRILIDAPCSNTGVMRRRADLRWRIRADELARLSKLQLELLSQSVQFLKPGGTLVYSTCSLEPEENGNVVRQFLLAQTQFQLEQDRELLPFRDKVDGAFVARLRRSS